MNYNRERLRDFCETNRFTVGDTLFHYKVIHKLTWKSPDGKTGGQIDQITSNNKWKTSLNDVRAKRSADVGSAHHLVANQDHHGGLSRVSRLARQSSWLAMQDSSSDLLLAPRSHFRVSTKVVSTRTPSSFMSV